MNWAMPPKRGQPPERPLWGVNPDPVLAGIEEAFFQVGFQFLARLYGAAMGIPPPRTLQKALGGPGAERPPGWGELATLFRMEGPPERLVASWQALVDRLVEHLLPVRTQEEAANRVAIHAHLYGRVRAQVAELPNMTASWDDAVQGMAPVSREAMAWTRLRALAAVRGLDRQAREGMMATLLRSRESGDSVQLLQRRLFEGFSEQNLDWRRLALTETATAVANGTLAAVDPEEGWETEWVAAPSACAWCRRWHGQRFRVVDPHAPNKDGQKEVWPGKTNIGRSASPRTRDGRTREAHERWWPAQPCHPCCRCQWVLGRMRLTIPQGSVA